MNDRDRQIVRKICVYCREIKETHEFFGRSEELFLDREKGFVYRNAVTMPILQIGELAKNLTDRFRSEHDTLPWKDIMGMRDIFAHHYGTVDYHMVWGTSLGDVEELRTYLESL